MAYLLAAVLFWAYGSLVMCQKPPSGGPQADMVNGLPRVRFRYTFKQYAGYLNAGDGNNYFYWYMDSQNANPSNDPLIVWFSSYPGCSALIGLLNEMGPFRPNPDGYSLYENVFSWNKLANILVIDSPAGVGWSYTTNTGKVAVPSDDQMATYNYNALRDFITKFSQYNSSSTKMYLAGEAYSGVYTLTLAKKILDNVKTNQFPDILKGVAVGNAYLSARYQTNSMIHFFYHHGLIGTDQWDSLMRTCCSTAFTPEDCQFYTVLTSNYPVDCAKLINTTIQSVSQNTTTDASNIFRDCYSTSSGGGAPRAPYNSDMDYLDAPIAYFPPNSGKPNDKTAAANNAPWSSYDPAHSFNYDSTDSLLGFSCWSNESKYLSQSDVMRALHVATTQFNGKQFVSCVNNFQYNQSAAYQDMTSVITTLLQSNKLRLLFYSGDLDMEYNFMGTQWFLDRRMAVDLKWKVEEQRSPWQYRSQTAGFYKRYTNLDEVTVKGSGRYVPMDRAGPALQMMNNFLSGKSYTTASTINVIPKPNGAISKGISFMSIWAELIALVILSRL